MKLKGLNFERWRKNHSADHKSIWYREIYPWEVLAQVDFTSKKKGVEQRIYFNWMVFSITIREIFLQSNGKYRCDFRMSSSYPKTHDKWSDRIWNNELLTIIYSQKWSFITVYIFENSTETDLYKHFVDQFVSGAFNEIVAARNRKLSYLLFRSLALVLSQRYLPSGNHHKQFVLLPNGVRKLPAHSQFVNERLAFAPLWSVGREKWICYAFREEHAHRQAFYLANQCKELIVVFCLPTHTSHHRCTLSGIRIYSLYEFAEMSDSLGEYSAHIRLLQSDLRELKRLSETELLFQIENCTHNPVEITDPYLKEALTVLNLRLNSPTVVLYMLAATNLINAWISRQRKMTVTSRKLKITLKKMYSFKQEVAKLIDHIVNNPCSDYQLYIQNKFVIVECCGIQFSFHHIEPTENIKRWMSSKANQPIEWRGKRLQQIATLIFDYAKVKWLNQSQKGQLGKS